MFNTIFGRCKFTLLLVRNLGLIDIVVSRSGIPVLIIKKNFQIKVLILVPSVYLNSSKSKR